MACNCCLTLTHKVKRLYWNITNGTPIISWLMRNRNRQLISGTCILFLLWFLLWPHGRDRHAYIYINFTEDPNIIYLNDSTLYKPNFEYSHPFDNTCKFPMLQPEDPSMEEFVDHSRQIQCPPATFDHFVTEGRDGELLIGRPANGLIEKTELECYYRSLNGSLYPEITKYQFDGYWKRLPINERFKINQTQFAIKCWSNVTHNMIYHNAFIGLPEKPNVPSSLDRYSIAILEIDSTSRNQFYRHMPHTLKFMRTNDFQILRGYTKVGDNSAINTIALLSGHAFESRYRGLWKLLPHKRQLTQNQTFSNLFDHVKMVYDDMKKDGCAVMFNDDPGTVNGGLFHYQSFDGFREPPTDYYFRPYYTYIYRNFFEEAQLACVNGEFLIPKWVNTWERFSTMYKDKCHFSFNHFSFFTHANGNNLELYDMHVSDALQRMKQAGVFDNTVIIVMGDHGQRIHRMKYGYYGKMEERMPLAAIHLPEKFKRTHPRLYRRFVTNTNRFTSTFDLHETLKLLTQLRYHNETETNPARKPKIPNIPKKEKVGRTLFEEIPKDRDCVDAKVPPNFCVCMEELDNDMNITDVKPEIATMLKDYLRQKLDSAPCLKKWEVVYESPMIVYAVNSLVRYGPRYIDEWERRITIYGKSAHIFREIVEIEKNLTLSLMFSPSTPNEPLYEDSIDLMFRFQYQRNETMRPIEELPWGATTYKNSSLVLTTDPWIYNAPCSALSLDQLCSKCNLPNTMNVLNNILPPVNFTAPNFEDNLTTSNVQESLKT